MSYSVEEIEKRLIPHLAGGRESSQVFNELGLDVLYMGKQSNSRYFHAMSYVVNSRVPLTTQMFTNHLSCKIESFLSTLMMVMMMMIMRIAMMMTTMMMMTMIMMMKMMMMMIQCELTNV